MRKLLASLSIAQRITIVAVALAVGGGLMALVHWKKESDFRPLFTSMAAEDAGAVVQKLKESGVEYRLSETGGAVLVPSAKLPELRLAMATAGLPKTGRIGFELFDKTNFGATEFTEQINYRRALEGELERSVMSLAEVEQARVHLTFPKDSVYLEARQPAKGSVLLRFRPGAHLAPANVAAITYLVASAVEGLAPESVSVLDMRGNLLNRPRRALPGGTEPSEATIDYRQKIESDLLAKIHATLEPLLGAEKFRASVSVECDFSGGEQSEETFDPSRSVMASSQKTEDATTSGGAGGLPGTASSLPRPTSRPGSTTAGTTRRTENVTFQTSRILRRVTLPQGVVKRMSVSLLLDQDVRWERGQRVLTPPAPEKLKSIRDVVAGIAGLNPQRGDQLIVESLAFDSTLHLEPPPATPPAAPPPSRHPAWLEKLLANKILLLSGAGGLGLILLLFCAVLFRKVPRKRPSVPRPEAPPAIPAAKAGARLAEPAMTTAQIEKQLEAQIAEREALKQRMEAEAMNSLKLPPVVTKKTEVLTRHLRDKVKQDTGVPTQVLVSWIREEGP